MLPAAIALAVILWGIIAAALGWAAQRKGYSFALGFAFAFLLTPLTALPVLAMLPVRDPTGAGAGRGGPPATTEDKGVAAIADAYRAMKERTPGRRAPPREE